MTKLHPGKIISTSLKNPRTFIIFEVKESVWAKTAELKRRRQVLNSAREDLQLDVEEESLLVEATLREQFVFFFQSFIDLHRP